MWWVTYGRSDGSAYVVQFTRADFIEMHSSAVTQKIPFDEFLKKLSELVTGYEALLQAEARNRTFPQPLSGGFPLALGNRRRRRF